MKDREYLERLVLDAQDTIYFLSSERKPERERRTCAAFLRCLGINFTPKEIVSVKTDPPDVTFRSAHFEVVEVLDEGRKRHDEWKSEHQRRLTAEGLDDLVEPYRPPEPTPFADILNLIINALAKKSARYGETVCLELDALVYVNLLSNVLDPKSPIPNSDELPVQGWRSVSMIMPLYSHVFLARESAPQILRDLVGETKSECTGFDAIFEL